MSRRKLPGIVRAGVLVLAAAAVAVANVAPSGASVGVPRTGSIIRFHVVANSNSALDQAVKLEVRDRLLALLEPHLAGASTEGQAWAWMETHVSLIRQTALQVVRATGRPYGVTVALGPALFPAKAYGDLVFPAGRYDALNVFLGTGAGQNWWCVLFPPLCLIDSTSAVATNEPASPSPQAPRVAAGPGAPVTRPAVRVGLYFPGLIHRLMRDLGFR